MSTLQTTILKHPDSGSNNIQFDSSGQVGIGTSPSAKFHINGSVGDFQIASDGATLNFTRDGANYIQAAEASATLNYRSSQHIFTGASLSDERFRIHSDGNVGIFTSSPQAKLDVNGNAVIGTDNVGLVEFTSTGVPHFAVAADASNYRSTRINVVSAGGYADLSFDAMGTAAKTGLPSAGSLVGNIMYLDASAQRVGIGCTDPQTALEISTSSADYRIQFGHNTGQNAIYSFDPNHTTYRSLQFDALKHLFLTSGSTKFEVRSNGPKAINPSAPTNGDSFAAVALGTDQNSWMFQFVNSAIGAGTGWGTFWAGSTNALYRRLSTETNPNEYVFVGGGSKRFTFDLDGGGNAYFDGSLEQNSYDYAEYFEWEDGNLDNEDRRGYSVFINSNGNIEKATAETDPNDIVGVVSGTSSIVGDAAAYNWHGKYEIDEWGTRKLREVTRVSWTDDDGVDHGYDDENNIPADVVVPDDAERRVYHKYIESESYDPSQEYIPRDQRQEWAVVGLLGKVRVRDESPKNPNWRLIKTVAGKQLWLIR